MDPMLLGAVIGIALRQNTIHSKTKKAYQLSVSAAERIAEAEVKIAQHQHETEVALEKLCKRIQVTISFLESTFIDTFKPFEGIDGTLKRNLIEDLAGASAVANLGLINSMRTAICQKPQIEKLANGNRISGTTMTASYILFGNLGIVSKQLDGAKMQKKTAELISTHMDTFCVSLDLQREHYQRIYQTLGALNVALITSTARVQEGLKKLSWLLDKQGLLPVDITTAELKVYLQKEDIDSLAICINIARCIYALFSEPLFDEDAELVQRAQALLDEGKCALEKIKEIENRRNQ